MTDCQCPSHVAKRVAAENIARLAGTLVGEIAEVERLRAGIRALSEYASRKAEEAMRRIYNLTEAPEDAGAASAYCEMVEKLEALLPEEPTP